MSIVSSVPAPNPKRNVFNLSRSSKGSTDFHLLNPIDIREVLPGDYWRSSAEVFVRFAPMVAPMFQNVKVSLHSFFVPLRELNNHFEEFITRGEKGTYNSPLPYTTLGDIYDYVEALLDESSEIYAGASAALSALRLLDFFGLPFVVPEFNGSPSFATEDYGLFTSLNGHLLRSNVRVNLAPFLAYVKVYDEYYRDQNLEDSLMDRLKEVVLESTATNIFDAEGRVEFSAAPGHGEGELFDILFRTRLRAYGKDRFTAALPFTQRGPDVLLPVSGTAPVNSYAVAGGTSAFNNAAVQASGPAGDAVPIVERVNGKGNIRREVDFTDADLTTTINDFRRAERLQRWYENSARGGSRYNENTLSHWGVRTKDARLDRAEFLGGSTQPVVVSEVQQNSATGSGATPLATLGGKGTSYQANRMYKRFFEEHGFIVTLMSVMVDATYSQGLPKMFSRMDSTEYAWPEFANLGEEPVYTKELFVNSNVKENTVFGYTPRYSDYKMAQNSLHGQFKSTLDFWTMSRRFANVPQLNQQFVMARPRLDSFAVTSEFVEHIYFMLNFHTKASRLLPYYGVPTI